MAWREILLAQEREEELEHKRNNDPAYAEETEQEYERLIAEQERQDVLDQIKEENLTRRDRRVREE
jgi:hypothetical protein